MKREPINYSNYRPYYKKGRVQKEYYELDNHEKRKGTLKKIGYSVKKIYEGKKLDCNIEIFNESDNVVISNRIKSASLFVKAFLLDNTTYLITYETAKDMRNKLMTIADQLVKKE